MAAAAICPETGAASDIDDAANPIATHNGNIDLWQHSLHAVVGHNKALWQSPPKWTQAHLEALCVDCVDRQTDADVDNIDCDNDGGLSSHAVIPILPTQPLDFLKRSVKSLTSPHSSWQIIEALDRILAFWSRLSGPQYENVNFDHDIEPPAFSHFRKCTIKLCVGPRAYPLRLLFSFHLKPLVLPVFDAFTIDNCNSLAHRRNYSNQHYEPYITAILIAVAQTQPFSTGESAVVTRLLFVSRRDNDRNMYVYTAHVSQRLLERFRYPNQPPTTYACSDTNRPSLIKLQHRPVPFEPNDTFPRRLLAAASVTATPMHEDEYYRRKRKCPGVCDIKHVEKRRRREDLQTPLHTLDANCC
ncbi:hypothetical protein F5X98DRAFT_122698 [Xylaria grammica]|nr:hypothetical protein F5X98DRAFT_122698 [Xylaria grammica]